jgi:uncharacterized protein (TIGR02246 family)
MAAPVPTTRDLLVDLVNAFGDPDAVCASLATDARWWITPTVGVLGSPSVGRDAIHAAMTTIFGSMYTNVAVDIHHVLTDGDMGAARFTMHATALFAEKRPYENEYTLWIERNGDQIVRVWEYLDVAHVMAQFHFQP